METVTKCQLNDAADFAKTETKASWWKLTTKEKKICLVLLGLLVLGLSTPHHFAVVISESIDHRVFFITPWIGKIKQGDYLMYNKSDLNLHIRRGTNGYTTDHMLKIVGCVPEDELAVNDGLYYTCNNVPLGQALEKDSKGNDMPLFKYQGKIPEDQYFMIGTNPRSYDSKYYGFINYGEFIAKAFPIW